MGFPNLETPGFWQQTYSVCVASQDCGSGRVEDSWRVAGFELNTNVAETEIPAPVVG